MSSTVSVSALADDVRATEARLAAMETKLDQLLKLASEQQKQMKASAMVLRPSQHGFSLANQLDTIRFYIEREFKD